MSLFRRLRGLVSVAIAWGIVWIPLGFVAIGLDAWLSDRIYPLSQLPQFAARFGVVGAGCGLVFGAVLALAERRTAFTNLSVGRMALWGFAGGIAIPSVFAALSPVALGVGQLVVPLLMFGTIGAITSVGTLALARRAPAIEASDSPELLRESQR